MKKTLLPLIAVICMLIISGCKDDTSTSPVASKKSYWKNTSKEIWWVSPLGTSSGLYEKINEVHWGISYKTSSSGGGVNVTYLGFENDLTRTDGSLSTNFKWSILPTIIVADSVYNIYGQVSGNGGNGISIGVPVTYNLMPDTWVLQSFIFTGKVTGKLSIAKPNDLNNPKKMMVLVNISSGYYYYLDYKYFYEWVTE